MKSYEKEAFLKSFSLFFVVQLLFLTVVIWQYHKSVSHKYDMHIMHEMTQCTYTLECSKYTMDFIEDLDSRSLNKFYKSYEYYMLFAIPKTKDYYMKLSISKEAYNKVYHQILFDNLVKYFLYILLLIAISIVFARFALRPLHVALNLNDEFVKDMLHDFNTPLSSLKINFKILQKKFGKDEAIERSEDAMKSIHDLQSNLSYFLSHSPLIQEKFDLAICIKSRIENYAIVFDDIKFQTDIKKVYLYINPESFVRILDNLLSNAAKYNVVKGSVNISFENKHLIIEDTGIGIKEPKKIFNRYYKETSRGMGIGLHVVKKLCDDLNIEIKVQSQLTKGTKFSLNLEKVMFN